MANEKKENENPVEELRRLFYEIKNRKRTPSKELQEIFDKKNETVKNEVPKKKIAKPRSPESEA